MVRFRPLLSNRRTSDIQETSFQWLTRFAWLCVPEDFTNNKFILLLSRQGHSWGRLGEEGSHGLSSSENMGTNYHQLSHGTEITTEFLTRMVHLGVVHTTAWQRGFCFVQFGNASHELSCWVILTVTNIDGEVCYLLHVRLILNSGGLSFSFELSANVCYRSENQGTFKYMINSWYEGIARFQG